MITAPAVDAYLLDLLPPRPPVLAAMEAQAHRRSIPIVGPVVARCFHLLVAISGARRIFELGSAIGYSTLWWALALEQRGGDGEVFFTDRGAHNAREAAGYFAQTGLAHRVHILEGDALDLLDQTPGDFDIIFCDLDKAQYVDALRRAVPRLRVGGLLVADNVLWQGQVASPAVPAEPAAAAMAAFNRALYAHADLFPVVLPLRDGVAVAQKLR